MSLDMPTFTIVTSSVTPGIRCLLCNRTSYNRSDVAGRYCNNCHLFHDLVRNVRTAHGEGAGHECDEWVTGAARCAICDAAVVPASVYDGATLAAARTGGSFDAWKKLFEMTTAAPSSTPARPHVTLAAQCWRLIRALTAQEPNPSQDPVAQNLIELACDSALRASMQRLLAVMAPDAPATGDELLVGRAAGDGQRKAVVFLRLIDALAALKVELQDESPTEPTHAAWIARIQAFSDDLMAAVEGKRPSGS